VQIPSKLFSHRLEPGVHKLGAPPVGTPPVGAPPVGTPPVGAPPTEGEPAALGAPPIGRAPPNDWAPLLVSPANASPTGRLPRPPHAPTPAMATAATSTQKPNFNRDILELLQVPFAYRAQRHANPTRDYTSDPRTGPPQLSFPTLLSELPPGLGARRRSSTKP
jgi:hypothetical protein